MINNERGKLKMVKQEKVRKELQIEYGMSITEESNILLCNMHSCSCIPVSKVSTNVLKKIKQLYFFYTFEIKDDRLELSRSMISETEDCADQLQDEFFRFINDAKLITLLLTNEANINKKEGKRNE